MGSNNLTFSGSIIGISYGEMNSVKSNLRRANDMLQQSQSKVNSAKTKVQIDRSSSRLRLSEEQISTIYTNAAKQKTKIDKLCNNIDITIRKFKEVDARCAARIRSISKSYDKSKSLWERIKSAVSSFMSFATSGLKSLLEEGNEAFNSLGNKNYYSESSQNKYCYNFLSEWMENNALATNFNGQAIAYKISTSLFDQGRSIFLKLGNRENINVYDYLINSAKDNEYSGVPYIKSKTYIGSETDEQAEEIESQYRAMNPQPGDFGDGLWGKFADAWISAGNWLSQWQEQNQVFVDLIPILAGFTGGIQIAVEKDKMANYEMPQFKNDVENFDYKEWENSAVSGEYRFDDEGLRIAKVKDLKKIRDYLNKKDIGFVIDTKNNILPTYAAGGFDYDTGEVVLRDNASFLSLMHESYHAEQYIKLGKEAYSQLTVLQREEYVYNRIMQNKAIFNDKEILKAQRYIYQLRNGIWPPKDWEGF